MNALTRLSIRLCALVLLGTGCSELEVPATESAFYSDAEREVVEGKPNGTWSYYYSTGELWQTIDFKEGVRHGSEVTFFRSGRTYRSGAWKDGLRDGTWTHWDTWGNVLGTSLMNKGTGLYTAWNYEGIRVSESSLVAGILHGDYRSWYETSGAPHIVERYDMGILHGFHQSFHEVPSGQLAKEGLYVDGYKEGTWTTYYPSGQLMQSYEFVNDLEEGPGSEWYENGQLRFTGNAKEGLRDGLWTEWYENGQMQEQGPFLAGERHTGESESERYYFWFESGPLQARTGFYNGQLHGYFEEWHEDGTKAAEANFAYGLRHGPYIRWGEDGEVLIDGTYENDELEGWAYIQDAEGVLFYCRFEGGEAMECAG